MWEDPAGLASEATNETAGCVMAFEEDAIRALDGGVLIGLDRASREGLEAPPDQTEEVRDILRDVIVPQAADLHPRFVFLFAEHVAIASAARSAYGEDPLSFEIVREYLSTTKLFFNSFTHP